MNAYIKQAEHVDMHVIEIMVQPLLVHHIHAQMEALYQIKHVQVLHTSEH